MNIAARVGVIAIAALLACGSIPAAHASPLAASLTETPRDPSDPALDDVQSGLLEIPCQLELEGERLAIAFAAEPSFDKITVTVEDQQVEPQATHETSVTIGRPESGDVVHLELWDNASLSGECVEAAPAESNEPSEDEPSPTETEGEHTEPPDEGEETATNDPTETSDPTPSETASPSPAPSSPSATGPSTPTPSESKTPPSRTPLSPSPPGRTAQSDTEPTDIQENTTERAGQRSQPSVQRQSEPLSPRIIRRFSNNQRDLLPQLLGLRSQTDSELIVPSPRSAEQEPPDLETLPPVSEDELAALKARVASPDHADPSAREHVAGTDAEEGWFERSSGWLLLSLIAAVCGGAAVLWFLKRRWPNH